VVFFKLICLFTVILQLTSIDTTLDHGGSNVDCTSIKLRDFPIEFCSREPTIRNEYDCALYIMLMMDRHNMLSSLNSLCQVRLFNVTHEKTCM